MRRNPSAGASRRAKQNENGFSVDMDRAKLLSIASEVAQQGFGESPVIGHLRLLNAHQNLKEPQLRHLWANQADRRGLYYAFEVPTFGKYVMKGKTGHPRSGMLDLVLYDKKRDAEEDNRSAIIEFKHGLSLKAIAGDLQKIMTETARRKRVNAAIMIVHERIWTKTFDRFFADLPRAVDEARKKAKTAPKDGAAWFELLVLIRTSPTENTQPAGLYRATGPSGEQLTINDLWNENLTLIPKPESRPKSDEST